MAENDKNIPVSSFVLYNAGDFIAEHARCLQEEHHLRHKLIIKKGRKNPYILEYLWGNRTHKIRIFGDSIEQVLLIFLKKHSEHVFGMEFELKE